MSVAHALFGNLAGGHWSIRRYEEVLGRAAVRRYFVFTFVRDPFDRFYSAWRYLNGGGMTRADREWAKRNLDPSLGFVDWVEQRLSPDLARRSVHLRPQVHFLEDRSGEIRADFIGRYESLDRDFQTVCARLGMARTLGRLNETSVPPSPVAWTAAAAERVVTTYADDFRVFGYTTTPSG